MQPGGKKTPIEAKNQLDVQQITQRHHQEMARASAAAMEQHYQEAIEITSELLTSGIYEQLAAYGKPRSETHKANSEAARRFRAEARLLMATAMHYAEAHYEDIVKVLSFAVESPLDVQKDVFFTLAVVHLSFGQENEARMAMLRSLELMRQLKEAGQSSAASDAQVEEANAFVKDLGEAGKLQVN